MLDEPRMTDEVIALALATGLRQVGPGGGIGGESIVSHEEFASTCIAPPCREGAALALHYQNVVPIHRNYRSDETLRNTESGKSIHVPDR
jgi:hypothetical protein